MIDRAKETLYHLLLRFLKIFKRRVKGTVQEYGDFYIICMLSNGKSRNHLYNTILFIYNSYLNIINFMKSLTILNQFLATSLRNLHARPTFLKPNPMSNINTKLNNSLAEQVVSSKDDNGSKNNSSRKYNKIFTIFAAFLAYNLTCKTLHLI